MAVLLGQSDSGGGFSFSENFKSVPAQKMTGFCDQSLARPKLVFEQCYGPVIDNTDLRQARREFLRGFDKVSQRRRASGQGL